MQPTHQKAKLITKKSFPYNFNAFPRRFRDWFINQR